MPLGQWAETIKNIIEKNPIEARIVEFSKQDVLFVDVPEFDPEEKIKVLDIDQHIKTIITPMRNVLHIFNPGDPNSIKTSTEFQKFITSRDPNDAYIIESMPFLLNIENLLREAATPGAEPLKEIDLADPTKYPFYIWFLLVNDPPAGEEELPIALGDAEIKRIESMAGT